MTRCNASRLFELAPLLEPLQKLIRQRNNLAAVYAQRPDFSKFRDVLYAQRKPVNDYRARCVVIMDLKCDGLSGEEVDALVPIRLEKIQRDIEQRFKMLREQYGFDLCDDNTKPEPWVFHDTSPAETDTGMASFMSA